MLRLPQFNVHAPTTLDEAASLLSIEGARIVAGGTDLLPNLKHQLEEPPAVVSLHRLAGLREVAVEDEVLRIGAGVTLSEVAEHDAVLAHAPSLARAAGLVAGPLHRNMGTLGGNVNLDVRCRYVNQTKFWREAIGGGCLKSEGDVCHVVPKGRNCVAAMSADTVPALISLDAEIVLVKAATEPADGGIVSRTVALSDYYRSDGERHLVKEPGELMTEVRVPLANAPRRTTYTKWTVRESIDFPLVSVALRFDLDADDVAATITAARAVVGVLNPKPRVVALDDVVGKRLSDPAVARIVGDTIHKRCKPLENVPFEAPYRRQMMRVFSRRAVEALVEAG